MRRSLMTALAACLLVGAVVAPAEAGKKKKPKPPPPAPITFEESGAFAVGHPGDVEAETSITRTAFLQSCAVPSSQGTDGYVIALPAEITAVATEATITGADTAGLYDLDLYFFDEACGSLGAISTEAPDEVGPMPAGTSFVLVTAYTGAQITFDFKATEIR